MPVTKIIVTNYKVMTDKYPSFYTGSILPAINELINADSARGITTTLVYLDNATQMQTYHATPVTIATDDQQNKVAIDGVYAWAQPNYLVILGSNDVVSQQ